MKLNEREDEFSRPVLRRSVAVTDYMEDVRNRGVSRDFERANARLLRLNEQFSAAGETEALSSRENSFYRALERAAISWRLRNRFSPTAIPSHDAQRLLARHGLRERQEFRDRSETSVVRVEDRAGGVSSCNETHAREDGAEP